MSSPDNSQTLERIGNAILDRIDDYGRRVARQTADLPGYSTMPEDARIASARGLGAVAVETIFLHRRSVSDAELAVLETVVRDRLAAGFDSNAISQAIYMALPELWHGK